MPLSSFDDDTQRVLEGALWVLEAMTSDAISESRKAETLARVTSQLVSAAREGQRDYGALQLRALDGFE
jgi:hypothetical protein